MAFSSASSLLRFLFRLGSRLSQDLQVEECSTYSDQYFPPIVVSPAYAR